MRTEGARDASKRLVKQGGARLAREIMSQLVRGVDARTLGRAAKQVLALARCGLCGWTRRLGFEDLAHSLAREA